MPKFSGETVEKAIEYGLSKLNLAREDVKIDVISEGKKGVFGFGKKEAKVKIEAKFLDKTVNIGEKEIKQEVDEDNKIKDCPIEKEDELIDIPDDKAITALALYLTNITRELETPALVTVSRQKEIIIFNLDTEKKGLLIGKHGKLINAIQYLAQVYIHRIAKNRLSIVVNVGDYREKREVIIQHLATKTLRKVRETGQPVFLEPMPAFERKQIHSILANEPDISTHSEGNEPHRYLVVDLKNS